MFNCFFYVWCAIWVLWAFSNTAQSCINLSQLFCPNAYNCNVYHVYCSWSTNRWYGGVQGIGYIFTKPQATLIKVRASFLHWSGDSWCSLYKRMNGHMNHPKCGTKRKRRFSMFSMFSMFSIPIEGEYVHWYEKHMVLSCDVLLGCKWPSLPDWLYSCTWIAFCLCSQVFTARSLV